MRCSVPSVGYWPELHLSRPAAGVGLANASSTTDGARALAIIMVAAITGLADLGAPAHAQQVLWDANGSAVAQGLRPPSTVLFTFQTPRGDFASQGASAGAVLLEIERDGQTFSGISYGFRPGCNPESYEVSGTVSADEKVITLQGRIPVRDASCKVVSFRDQTLVVAKQPPAAQIVQTPRPRAPAEQCDVRQGSNGTERYCASSVLAPQFGNSYNVRNLFSGGDALAWVEGQAGQGIGEWIVVEFSAPRRITGLAINNGYQKNQDIYYKNSRVRRIDVRFSQGQSETLALADRFGTQDLAFTTPVVATWLQIIIRDVYPGAKYTDTAISKLFVQSAAAN
jgi:hypothetical protein